MCMVQRDKILSLTATKNGLNELVIWTLFIESSHSHNMIDVASYSQQQQLKKQCEC